MRVKRSPTATEGMAADAAEAVALPLPPSLDAASLPADVLGAIQRQLSRLDDLIHAAVVCRSWRASALLLLHDHGKGGVWYNLCCQLSSAVPWMQGVGSYWSLYTKLRATSRPLPEMRLDELQFMITVDRHEGMHGGSYEVLWSRTLAGADASCYMMAATDEDDAHSVYAGSWYWTVPTLLDILGWGSVAHGRAVAERWAQLEEAIEAVADSAADDDDAEALWDAEARVEHEMAAAQGGRFQRDAVQLMVFHAPTQRVLPLVHLSPVDTAASAATAAHELRFLEQPLFTTNYSVAVSVDTVADECRLSVRFMEDGEMCDVPRAMFALQSAVEGWK